MIRGYHYFRKHPYGNEGYKHQSHRVLDLFFRLPRHCLATANIFEPSKPYLVAEKHRDCGRPSLQKRLTSKHREICSIFRPSKSCVVFDFKQNAFLLLHTRLCRNWFYIHCWTNATMLQCTDIMSLAIFSLVISGVLHQNIRTMANTSSTTSYPTRWDVTSLATSLAFILRPVPSSAYVGHRKPGQNRKKMNCLFMHPRYSTCN